MKRRTWMLVGMVTMAAATATADVSHYRPMAERLAIEGERHLQRKDHVRALEEFVRLFHYDGDYAPASQAMLRIAQILMQGKAPGLAGRRKDAVLLLRYVLGTPQPERAARQSPSGIDPVAEAGKELAKLGQATARPLSNSMGRRHGLDAKLAGVKQLASAALEACHRAMPVMEKGGLCPACSG